MPPEHQDAATDNSSLERLLDRGSPAERATALGSASDSVLVGLAADFAAGDRRRDLALIELQRRLVNVTRSASDAAQRQAAAADALGDKMLWLTVATVMLALVQIFLAIVELIAG